ncbi:MAG: hypothetical protein NE327_18320, partial [Lentisphaeraceae bacterium]|nr:hypothetical protein [Lentisphaeraceae bacterium]
MIFRLFYFFLFLTLSVQAEKKWQTVNWDTPEGWELVEVGKKYFPYVFVGSNNLKISLLRHEYRNDAIWVFSKVYRESLGLPLLTEEELEEKAQVLENEAVYHEFTNDKNVVTCAFFQDFGFLWVLKYEGEKRSSGRAVKALRSIAASFKFNEEFQKHIKDLQAKEGDDKAELELSGYYDIGFG